MAKYSLGTVRSSLDNINLGSVLDVSIDMSHTVLPTHKHLVGSTKINPSEFTHYRSSGKLSITTDEFNAVIALITSAINSAKTGIVSAVNFDCVYFNGIVFILPDFSFSFMQDNWASVTINTGIKSINLHSEATPASLCSKFIKQTDRAVSVDKSKLCPTVLFCGLSVGSISMQSNCVIELVYDDDVGAKFPHDCVLNESSVELDIGIIDFTTVSVPNCSQAKLEFLLLDGKYEFILDNPLIIPQGFKSNNSINTWHLKVYGRFI